MSTELKPKTVAVIREHLDNKAVVPLFVGTLTKLFPAKQNKPGEERQWCIQNGELKDDNGGTIEVSFRDRDPMDVNAWKGKRVTLSCKQGDKGPSGVYVFDDEYDGKNTRKLKVTATGILEMEGGNPQPQQQETRQQQRQQEPNQQRSQQTTTHQQKPSSGVTEMRHVIAKVAALHNVCLDAAVNTAKGLFDRHGYAVVPTTVFIWADKYLMEAIRRTGIEDIPFNPYASKPYGGVKLIDLIPALREQINESKEAAHATPPLKKPEPQTAEQTPSYQEGLEDDDIPF